MHKVAVSKFQKRRFINCKTTFSYLQNDGLSLVVSFHYIGDVNRKDGKHHHTYGGQHHRKDFAGRSYGYNIRAYSCGIHKGPPKCIGIMVHQWIHIKLCEVESQATEINACEQYHQVGDKQARYFVFGKPTGYNG